MAQFPILRLTRAGQDLVGMSQGGGKLIFVRAELGDGQLGEMESVETLRALKRRAMQLPLQGYLNEGNGKARLRFVVDNSALAVGFFNREIGIVAKMEGGDEQLYAYTNAGNYADYIPSKDTPIDSEIIDLHIVIGNASHVVLETQNGAYATKIELEEHRTAAELDHPDKSVRRKHLADNIYTLPAPEPADNTRFLRNDGTYQTITPNNIGAYHKSESYNKGEVDGRVNAKVSKNGDTMTGALTAPRFYTNDWFRSYGSSGWYNETYGGGIWMQDSDWIRTYGRKNFYCDRVIRAGEDIQVADDGAFRFNKYNGGWHMQDPTWIRALNDKSIYTGGKMKADGGFEGTATNANKLQNWSLQQILDEFLNVWHATKAYSVGDIAYHKNLPSWARLECVTAGTTGNNANIFSKNVKAGQYIIDGGVQWIIDDVRDGNRVGSVAGSLYLPDGYIKANGATVQRADYPRLVALADKHNLWTNDTANNLGMFGRGNGSSTFVLPNWIDRMMQFAAQGGSTLAAGLPNITGQVGQGTDSMFSSAFCTGAFRGSAENSPAKNAAGGYRPIDSGYAVLDASKSNPIYGRSNTVQPAAIRLIPIIKY